MIPAGFEIKENSLEFLVFLEILASQEAPVGGKIIKVGFLKEHLV